ncbi:MAG TPA: FGGY family carbohydrate kinase [Solirubrobacteraceae bacterium]|nr:FGGY family carbohydrate kinase [Solirubrobacteraceae bacterium]
MSGRPLLLGIDEGTTAVKAALFDARLRPAGPAARRIVGVRHPQAGWVEKDALEILQAVIETADEVLRAADGPVVACGIDHEGESVLAWDAVSREPLTAVIVWQDRRAQVILDELAGSADEIRARTGLPLDPYFSAGKLAWLLRHDAAVARAREAGTLRMGTVDAFLCERLGAGFATDASSASRTQLLALGGTSWDPWLLERFGIPAGVLPPVGGSVGGLGALSDPSWPGPVPLRARACDQQAALAGAGCVTPGRVKATYGTGVFVLAHTGASPPQSADDGLLPTVAWRIAGRDAFALDGGVFAAGAMLAWLAGSLGLAESPAALGELAREVPDARGVRLLPALAGLGAPWWEPEARAVIAGIDGGATSAHIARAAFEGIAWRVADIVERIGESTPVTTLRVDGGLTNEPLLLQLQADAAGVPVETGGADATVLGAAALAGVGAGVLDGIEAIAPLVSSARRVEPVRDATWRAREHDRWRAFVRGAAALR